MTDRITYEITVAVCTYNRAGILRDCLKSLVLQTADRKDFEILVIDNNSSDNTPGVVRKLSEIAPNLRYFQEPNQGLSHARNRAWKEAKGGYVAYTDDDCLLPRDWLQKAKEVIDTVSPGIFGGPYYPYYNSPKPRWFKDIYETHSRGQCGFLGKNEFLDGGNFFIRKDLIAQMNGFRSQLGMSGKKQFYGEETLLQLGIREKRPDEKFYYDPALYVFHLVRPEKMKLRWNLNRFFNLGRATYLAFEKKRRQPAKRLQLIKETAGVLVDLCKNIGEGFSRTNRPEFPYIRNFHYEQSLPLLVLLGKSFEQFRHLK